MAQAAAAIEEHEVVAGLVQRRGPDCSRTVSALCATGGSYRSLRLCQNAPVKKLLIVAGVVVAIGLLAGVLLVNSLGEIVVRVVSEVGTRAAGAPVVLQSADVSLTDARAELTELTVGNPEGFEAPRAIRLGRIVVDIDEATLNSNPIVIRRVVIEAPEITVELDTGGTNLAALRDNVRKFERELRGGDGGRKKKRPRKKDAGTKSNPRAPASPTTGTEEPGDEADERRFVIRELVIREGRIQFGATFLGKGTAGASLPEIVLNDIGSGQGGLTPGEVAAEILSVLTDRSLEIVSGVALDGVGDLIKGTLDAGKKLLDGILGK